jgi:RNA-directed DNA polymerase
MGAGTLRERDQLNKGMKRKNNIYEGLISIENLLLADKRARKGKAHRKDVKQHDKQRGCNILSLHNALADQTFYTSPYTTFPVFEPKERLVYCLPYYPDRIAQHAVMNKLESVFTNHFTANTYSCIKGKGIHAAAADVKKALKDVSGTTYCLKLDVKKFYPSIDHDILKHLLRRILKDKPLLAMLDNIIDSADGVPIGNYLSQYFANFYLSGFDHWLKEVIGVKHYFRYADDMVILSGSKEYLHQLSALIRQYLATQLKLTIKGNYQVFPVAMRGIDFVGYVFYHTHTWLRKSIKQNMARNRNNPVSTASYYGWAIHCDSGHLRKKLNTHATILRLKNKNRDKGVYGRQPQNRQSIQYRNNRIGLQNRTGQIQRQAPFATGRI